VKYELSQEVVDEFSVLSQKRFAAAQEGGRLASELCAVEIPGRKGPTMVNKDEHNRPDATVESLKKLPKSSRRMA